MRSRYERFSLAVSGIYHCIQKIEREEMEQYGFKGPFAQYLATMSRHPEGMTSAQLSDLCDRDKAAVSRAVAEMETKDLLTRAGAGETLYRARLQLTDAGRKAADFVCRRAQEAVDAAGGGLTDEERAAFYAALEQIAGNLQRISREGIPQKEGE